MPAGINENFVIPSSVISIDDGAALCCKKLTKLEIHAGVSDIGGHAFCGCENLEIIIDNSKENIKIFQKAIVFEAEKSVLKYGSCFTMNKSVAVGGSAFSQYHGLILKEAGVETIVLAFDNDYSEDGDRFYGLQKMLREAQKVRDMGFKVELIYDWTGEYLGDKDAPIDLGRTVYSKLYRERKTLEEVLEENEEEETREVSTENEELQ